MQTSLLNAMRPLIGHSAHKPAPRTVSVNFQRSSSPGSPFQAAKLISETSHGSGFHHPSDCPYPFFSPPQAVLGSDALRAASTQLPKFGKHALIIVDKKLDAEKSPDRVKKTLDAKGIKYTLFEVHPSLVTEELAAQGAKLYKDSGCDFLISYGGGSVHDTAKAVGLLAANPSSHSIMAFEGVNNVKTPIPSLVAITTTGSGAELTRFLNVTAKDPQSGQSRGFWIIDNNLTPSLVVSDPNLQVLPRPLLASSGFQSLALAIESYLSTASTPLTDANALQAISMLSGHLVKSYEDGSNMKSREKIAYGKYLSALAYNSSSTGYCMALSLQIAERYNVHVGVAAAVLLPHVLDCCAPVVPELFIDIALAQGNLCADKFAEHKVVTDLKEVREELGLPSRLALLGVKKADFGEIALGAMQDSASITSPWKPLYSEILALLERAY